MIRDIKNEDIGRSDSISLRKEGEGRKGKYLEKEKEENIWRRKICFGKSPKKTEKEKDEFFLE